MVAELLAVATPVTEGAKYAAAASAGFGDEAPEKRSLGNCSMLSDSLETCVVVDGLAETAKRWAAASENDTCTARLGTVGAGRDRKDVAVAGAAVAFADAPGASSAVAVPAGAETDDDKIASRTLSMLSKRVVAVLWSAENTMLWDNGVASRAVGVSAVLG